MRKSSDNCFTFMVGVFNATDSTISFPILFLCHSIDISIFIQKEWIDSKFKFCDVLSRNLMRCVNTFEFLTLTKRTSSLTNLLRYEKVSMNFSRDDIQWNAEMKFKRFWIGIETYCRNGIRTCCEMGFRHVAIWDLDMLKWVLNMLKWDSDMPKWDSDMPQCDSDMLRNGIRTCCEMGFGHAELGFGHAEMEFRCVAKWNSHVAESGFERCWIGIWTLLNRDSDVAEMGFGRSWIRIWTLLNWDLNVAESGFRRCWNRIWTLLNWDWDVVELGFERCWIGIQTLLK